MRLFAALWPDAAAQDEVDDALGGADVDAGCDRRATERERRHVTLRFHDDADPDAVAARLHERAAGLPAPRLRIVGAGTFPGVLWLGVQAADPEPLRALVAAADGAPDRHVAHLTVARHRHRTSSPPPVPAGLAGFTGSWWTPDAVVLVASGRPYRVLARVPLGTGPGTGGHGRAGRRR